MLVRPLSTVGYTRYARGMTKYRVNRIDHIITASTVDCYLGTVKIWPMNYCHTHNAFWNN